MDSNHNTTRPLNRLVLKDPGFIFGVLASVFLFFSMIYLPIVGMALVIFTPLPLVYFYYRRGRSFGLAMIATATVVTGFIFTISSDVSGALLFLGYGLWAAVLAECFRMGLAPEKIVGIPAGFILGLVLFILVVLGVANGQNPWAYTRDSMKTHIGQFSRFYVEFLDEMQRSGSFDGETKESQGKVESLIRPVRPLTPEASADIQEKVERLTNFFTSIFPGFFCVWLLFFTWLNFLMARAIFNAKGILAPNLVDLTSWRAPEFLIWGAIVFGILVFLPIHILRSIGFNGLIILSLIYFFGGIAVLAFWLDKKAVPRGFRMLIYIFIAFQLYILGPMVVGLGLFDLWFDFRKLKTPDPDPPA